MGPLLRDVFDGFRRQPVRAGLAIVAVAVGAASLGLLIGALASLEATSRRLVGELGADAAVALPEPGGDGATGLGFRHVRLVRAAFPDLLLSTIARSESRTIGSSERLQVLATDPFLARARDWLMVDGRFLDERDLERGERHAVISERLATEWRWRVGNVVLLGDLPFVVVGVVRTRGSALAGQFGNPDLALGERLVLVPRTVTPLWIEGGMPEPTVDAMFLKASGRNPANVLAGVQALLSQPGLEHGPLSWVTPETLVERIDRLKAVIGGTAATVSLLCLILGGTTLMSLMVANIHERVAEIGLRLALGATRSEITALFVAESLALTLSGALAGVALAHLVMAVAVPLLPIPLVTGWASWGVPVASCVLFGLLFSYGPATRAAKVSPAAALRMD